MSTNWMTLVAEYLGGIPEHYLVLDLETSGFGHDDLILEAGYCLVQCRKPVHQGSVLLNWTDPTLGIDQDWLQDQIARIQRAMAEKGRCWSVTYERLRDEGQPVHEALDLYVGPIEEQLEDQGRLVGHNIWNFDLQRLVNHARHWLRRPLQITAPQVLDTGIIEIARGKKMLPTPGGSVSDWYSEVYRFRGQVKWSLSEHCWDIYGLREKYALDATQAHGGEYDCWSTHLLLERMRELSFVEIQHGPRPGPVPRPRPARAGALRRAE